MKTDVANVDEYIAGFPADIRKKLQQMREVIRKAAPKAEETIKYAMPAYVLHGHLVFFAAFKNHIGFYATPTGHDEFAKELSKYKSGRGSVQFPLDEPLPLSLIKQIVKFRVAENLASAKAQAKPVRKSK